MASTSAIGLGTKIKEICLREQDPTLALLDLTDIKERRYRE